ncbi:MAG: tyrosine-type recombinase/integrase [Hydrogenoanaerobacterium sp.]
MVAGRLQEKNGNYYTVLTYNDEAGKRKEKWQTTGLAIKGNKKKAEALLMEIRKSFQVPKRMEPITAENILFSDFMLEWLEVIKPNIELITYSGYSTSVKGTIVPYFEEKGILLKNLKANDLQTFYTQQLRRVSASTVIRYHANMHKALKFAVRMDMLLSNPADKVDRPKAQRYSGQFYDAAEIGELFAAFKGTKLELAVMFGAFYGLRRSEIVGLKWSAIDFTANTLTIRHTVTSCTLDGKQVTIAKDRTKTKSSMRTLPLVPQFREYLLALKEKQENYRKLCGNSYSKKYLEYIYVDELGERMSPNYITAAFPQMLEKFGLRKIRFHDTRHSCASLLLANGVPMKQIQEWLGHSTFATTADIYAHLDYNSKISSADALLAGLNMGAINVKSSIPQVR